MLLSKAVTVVSFLIAAFCAISAMPEPGIIRERHVIHAPIKIKTIHHYKVKKVPIIIRKHLHYYKPKEVHPKPVVEEHADDDAHYDHHEYYHHQMGALPKDESSETSFQGAHHEGQEDDYEEPEQSQEEQYEEEYEYE